MFTGDTKADVKKDAKLNRLVLSIGQDICRAATKGKWALPKHILLCMTLRHMFRSKELITLLNRFGHSENYYFSLESETAIAHSVKSSSSVLSPEIIRNPTGKSVFHSEFDNFDKYVNDIFGSGIVNTAHGIMLQEVESDETASFTHTAVKRTKQKRFDCSEPVLPECYVSQRKSPTLTISQKRYEESGPALEDAVMRNMLWVMLRQYSTNVPGWGGFVSTTGVAPRRLTTIGYYPVIPNPITEYSTVSKCLDDAANATKEVGQKYVIVTFDLGVCMKAYPLIFNNPLRYKEHIIMIGTFHLICGYFKMIGKKMNSSGFADILHEASLVKSGTVKGVINGKNYTRSMACHKLLVESMERLLIEQYLRSIGTASVFEALPQSSLRLLNELLDSPSETNLKNAMKDSKVREWVNNFLEFKDKVRKGSLGKTAQFWLSYMDHVWLALYLHESVKRNDFYLYAHCIHAMPDLFFSFDGQNYARYLTTYSIMLANIDETHPGALDLLKQGAFSVARSFVPGCRTDVDKTMEETFMKQAKSHSGAAGAGVTGIARDYQTYQRWIQTTHERSKYLSATFSIAGLTHVDHKVHKDLRKRNIKKSYGHLEATVAAIRGFLNPFALENDGKLYNLSSGAPVPPDIEVDILRADASGLESRNKFVKDRLEKSKDFFVSIKRSGLKTMADMNKSVTVKTSDNKLVEYKNQGNVIAKLLVKALEGEKLDLDQIMKFCLTPIPYCLATADGYLAKNEKCKSLTGFTKEVGNEKMPTDKTLTVEDGNAIFYIMKQIPDTFRTICKKVYETVSTGDVIVSTDMYCSDSIKTMERKRRGDGEKLIVQGPSTKRPRDWKKFLANSENKQQFISLLHEELRRRENFNGRKFIFVKDGQAFDLTMNNSIIPSLTSNQEETDSRVILYALYASEKDYNFVRIKSPDSDIFWIMLYHARGINCQLLYDTGFGNKRRLINVTQISEHYTQAVCNALLGVHGFTGCDTASCFKGKGKVRPMKMVIKSPSLCSVFGSLGESWNVPDSLVAGLEKFVCSLYGGKKSKIERVDELRAFLMKSKCDDKFSFSNINNIDFSAFPPSRACLEQHVRRVNYQVRIWKLANVQINEVPKPSEGHGWTMDGEPLWCDDDWILPSSLADIVAEDNRTTEEVEEKGSEDEDEEEYEADMEVFEDGDMPVYDEIDIESDDSSYESD